MAKNTGKVREFCQSGKVGTLLLLIYKSQIFFAAELTFRGKPDFFCSGINIQRKRQVIFTAELAFRVMKEAFFPSRRKARQNKVKLDRTNSKYI